jgi:hypothetical protein
MTHDPQIAVGHLEARAAGTSPTGIVGLRNFDEGVVETLGGEVHDVDTGEGLHSNYYLPPSTVLPVEPAPGLPGIPITFSHPEDVYARYRQPVIVVRRDDISPAMNRWHPGHKSWRAPAQGAKPVTATFDPGTRAERSVNGFDSYETKDTGVPFDFTYTISILARHRGKGPLPRKGVPTGFKGAEGSPRNQVNLLLNHVLRRTAPYCQVFVWDSLGDRRKYSGFMEAISHLDEVPEVTERVLGFAVTLRVEAELDLSDPVEHAAVRALTLRTRVL